MAWAGTTDVVGMPRAGETGLWQRLTLARKFTLVAVAISLVSVIFLGSWVSRTLEESIIERAGAASAVYTGHFLAPHLQELAFDDELSTASIAALDRINESVGINMRLHAMKVWLQDGRIVFASNKELIGQTYPHSSLDRAWAGFVTAEFNELHDDENASERNGGPHLLEVYAPIYSEATDEVIAVAEFYEQVDDVPKKLATVRWQSWLVTALLAAAMVFSLFSIVADGSRTIERQRYALTLRIAELSRLLQHNQALRDRIKRGARQVVEDHEYFLHQIGSDLHDGPAQFLGLALLRLDRLDVADEEARHIRAALSDALEGIRNISAGLLLPEARGQNLQDALLHTIRDHERRTQTAVAFHAGDLPSQPPHYVNVCLCRVVQEGLSNAFHHAGGKGQAVRLWADERTVSVEVRDQGPGFPKERLSADHKHMGLLGLRGRVESIGGTIAMERALEGGARLVACLPAIEEE
ncbi:MAG TPA: ATP-binding protein [Alphaproteobacteria bacterium]|jgi:signal transduction histidine kinase